MKESSNHDTGLEKKGERSGLAQADLADKKAWRAHMLRERAALAACATRRDSLAEGVQRHLLDSDIWRSSRNVLLYAAMQDEVDTWLLLAEAWRAGKNVFLPRCLPGVRGEMEMLACSCREELITSRMGIPEPREGAAAFSGCASVKDDGNPEAARLGVSDTLIVVPGLVFDRKGFRIGYGGGYYDRLLGRGGLRSVGLVFAAHIVDLLPRDPWDVPVHGLCTEEGLTWL